jgi:hypothetical protein
MSTTHELVLVRVEADPVVSVCIMKGDLTIVKEKVGRLEVKVPPGLYKVRFAAPTVVRDAIFEVTGEEPVITIPVPADVVVASPAPLTRATKGTDHESLAARLSVAPPVHLGDGGSLFVFVRQLPETKAPAGHPTAGVTLRTSSGEQLFDFGNLPVHNGCAGVNLSVAPGTYLLRVVREGDAAPIEQSVVVCSGWQTQIFLPLGPLTCDDPDPRPQLEHAAVFMADEEVGFQPAKPASEWTEMARSWLARGRAIVPIDAVGRALDDAREVRSLNLDAQMVRRMLRDKLSNPMLGIYAAHLMIIQSHPDEAVLSAVSDTLKDLIGDHPDVLAIDMWLSGRAVRTPYASPPMLRTSWDVLVNRSREHDQLAPSGSYSARISGRLWGGGAWLIWCAPPAAAAVQPQGPIDLIALAEQIRLFLGPHTPVEALYKYGRDRLTPTEVAVFRYIANVIYGERYVQQVAKDLRESNPGHAGKFETGLADDATTFAHKELTADSMLQKLAIPAAALKEAATTLGRKLQARV